MKPQQLITIHLEKMLFFAYHGLYESEKKAGNEFEMSVSLSFKQNEEIIKHINETIDYVKIYELVYIEMQQPRELLETFLTELAVIIKNNFPETVQLTISLYKLTVPIAGLKGRIGVQLNKIWD